MYRCNEVIKYFLLYLFRFLFFISIFVERKIEIVLIHIFECSETQRTNSYQYQMATKVASPTAAAAASKTEGLTFEVRECDDGHLYSPKTPLSPTSPVSPLNSDDCEGNILTRSESASLTDPPASAPEAPKDANISRVQVGDNAATQAVLHFLTSQGINTTKFVTEHMMRYGSRIRVATTDDGKIVGCLIFDNEADVAELLTMTPEEAKKSMGPFIFMQLLIVDPQHAADEDKHWKERLVASFLECVVKNGKIAIVRADADNQKSVDMYRSCGFFTMSDMGVPSYSSIKSNMEILAFTPLGLEGTSQLFKRFYELGARF
jgi:ribosomal protein S18 acetylase RimI-like enzyme